jgi:hypothetical protein
VAEAVDFYAEYKTAKIGGNTTMVDSSGDAAVVEKSPTRQEVRRPQNGTIWCTNHPTFSGMRELWDVVGMKEGRLEGSGARYAKLQDFLEGYDGTDAVGSFEDILRTHGPGGICQHNVLWTLFSLITIPKKREMRVTDGPPCKNEFATYRLQ